MKIPHSLNWQSVGALASSVRTALSAVAAGWEIEHRPDGRHKLPWVTPRFSAGDFTSDAGAWTVTNSITNTFTYWLIDNTMTVSFILFGTSVSGAPAFLYIRIPEGRVVASTQRTVCRVVDNLTQRLGVATVVKGESRIRIRAVDFATAAEIAGFANSASATDVEGQITFEVE